MESRRRFGKIVYKPNKQHPKRIEASYPTPTEAYENYANLSQRQVRLFPLGGEDEAAAWLGHVKRSIDAGVWQPEQSIKRAETASRITVGEYWPDWLKKRRTNNGKPLKPSTYYRLEKDIRLHVAPFFDNTRMVDVDESMIDDWFDWLPADQQAMRMNAWKAAHAIFATASKPGNHGATPLLDRNPFDARHVSKPRKQKITVLATPEEIKIIHDNMPARYANSIYLGCYVELRIGEVCALQRADINLQVGLLRVRRGRLTMGDDVVGKPKTESSINDQIIPPQLMPILRKLLEQVPEDPQAWIFPSIGDPMKPLHPNTLRGWFSHAREKAGRPDLWFHELRHTALTWTAQDGATLEEVMASGRHSDVKSAMVYQHAASRRRQEIAEKLGSRLLPDDTVDIITARIANIDEQISRLQEQRKAEEKKLEELES